MRVTQNAIGFGATDKQASMFMAILGAITRSQVKVNFDLEETMERSDQQDIVACQIIVY